MKECHFLHNHQIAIIMDLLNCKSITSSVIDSPSTVLRGGLKFIAMFACANIIIPHHNAYKRSLKKGCHFFGCFFRLFFSSIFLRKNVPNPTHSPFVSLCIINTTQKREQLWEECLLNHATMRGVTPAAALGWCVVGPLDSSSSSSSAKISLLFGDTSSCPHLLSRVSVQKGVVYVVYVVDRTSFFRA